MKSIKISLFDRFSRNILTRSRMQEFFSEIESKKSDKVILDFKNIKFISRSCADEYLKLKRNTSKTIEEINLTKNISKMLSAVRDAKNSFFKIASLESKNPTLCYN